MNGVAQTKTNKAKRPDIRRYLEKRAAKVIENDKRAMFIKFSKTNTMLLNLMNDFAQLKKPDSIKYNKRNAITPFEDATSLEFFSEKSDSSLFGFVSHTKKRPNNLILGRMFDHHVLDMVEFEVTRFKSIIDFSIDNKHTAAQGGSAFGSKPCFIFQGQEFDQNVKFRKVANLLLDFFRGHKVDAINLAGLDHVIVCTSVGEKVYFKRYHVGLKKSGTRIPRVELTEIGPSVDLTIKRYKFASKDLSRASTFVPNQLLQKKVKNVSRDKLGRTNVRIHVGRQSLETMDVRRPPALRGKRSADKLKQEANKKVKFSTE